ncbi:MAG: hypothetical protein AB7P21_02910 [Lautropia sp.]
MNDDTRVLHPPEIRPSVGSLDTTSLRALMQRADGPCISLYMPTHRRHPENQQDPIRFRNLLKEARRALDATAEDAGSLSAPLARLANDEGFWRHTLGGLAVLLSPGVFRVVLLQREVPERIVVADTFHLKPLMRIARTVDRYMILAIDRASARLYEGDRDALDPVPLAGEVPKDSVEALGDELTDAHHTVSSYGGIGRQHGEAHHGQGGRKSQLDLDAERYFRAVDRAVHAHHSAPSGLPLILATLPEHRAMFHRVSHNPALLDDGIDGHPDSMDLDTLRTRAWAVMAPRYDARLDALAARFSQALAAGRASDALEDVAKAVVAGRVDTMMVEADRIVAGRVDRDTGRIDRRALADPDTDDVLDDLAAMATGMGADVVVVPAQRMPSDGGVAATFRF